MRHTVPGGGPGGSSGYKDFEPYQAEGHVQPESVRSPQAMVW